MMPPNYSLAYERASFFDRTGKTFKDGTVRKITRTGLNAEHKIKFEVAKRRDPFQLLTLNFPGQEHARAEGLHHGAAGRAGGRLAQSGRIQKCRGWQSPAFVINGLSFYCTSPGCIANRATMS
jgi:hypothetical protein